MPADKPLPKIAVCLTVYNGSAWLAEQLRSILEQADVCVTVFVSIDRSEDGSEAWMNQQIALDSRIQALPYGFEFGCAARNFFRILHEVDFSGFDYISFSDQDDIWLPHKLARAHQLLSSTGADAYSSNAMAFWPNGRQALVKKSQPQRPWDFLFEAAGPGCTYVMKLKLVFALQDLLNQRWTEIQQVGMHDWFIYAFARAQGYQWVIDKHSEILYRQHGNNQLGVNSGLAAFIWRMRHITSGWGFHQAAFIAELVGLGDHDFVRRWSRGGRLNLLWLMLHSGQCRRRFRDQVLFAVSCLVLAITGWR